MHLLAMLALLLQGPDSTLAIDAAGFTLRLDPATQVAVSLAPVGAEPFDFLPADRDSARQGPGYYHLGDLTLAWRSGDDTQWHHVNTVISRAPVRPLMGGSLAAADLSPALPADLPLAVRRSWVLDGNDLVLRFDVTNRSAAPIEIGSLGIPLPFDNILGDRSLDEAHALASFTDPSISQDAGYVQVTRLSGAGPSLVVAPWGRTPLEGWSPLLDEKTRRGITFEGFYQWLAHTRAEADSAWKEAEPWNPPTSATLAPGATRSWGVRFLLAPSIRGIEQTLADAGRPVAVGVPGYVLPQDLDARLFLKHAAAIRRIAVEPAGAIRITPESTGPAGWQAFTLRGIDWGRARVTVTWADGIEQTIHYKVIHPARQVVGDLASFLTNQQWFDKPDDPFGRSPSVISYDNDTRTQVTEDNRAWIAGLGDEGGSGSWLAAMMTQLVRPDSAEVSKLQRFVDGVLWGGLQYADGPRQYGVRKSMFYYEPDSMPPGTYSDSIRYGGWSSWNREHAMSVGRSYDYPHVAAAYWVLYRNARNHVGLVTNHEWDWYLDHAWRTAEAMVRLAPDYARFGQMEGTVFVMVLADMRREGWDARADSLEGLMRQRALEWKAMAYPFGSEMPWDSTGQEEVYAWCRYFGFDDKALVTLNAILGYMPTVPHWGYNGSARRYWDFQYAGKLRRVERQLHHYGSGLNAIPVLSEFRLHPDDLYLLRVGYGGLLGSIANVTEDGFGPSGFHAWPSTLRIDGYSGDYGSGFFGHAVNAATYVTRDSTFGWLAFGGNWRVAGDTVVVTPLDAARSRLFIGPLGLWITLDAGTIEQAEIMGGRVQLTLSPADRFTPVARLRVEGSARPVGDYQVERGAWVVPLSSATTRLDVIARR